MTENWKDDPGNLPVDKTVMEFTATIPTDTKDALLYLRASDLVRLAFKGNVDTMSRCLFDACMEDEPIMDMVLNAAVNVLANKPKMAVIFLIAVQQSMEDKMEDKKNE